MRNGIQFLVPQRLRRREEEGREWEMRGTELRRMEGRGRERRRKESRGGAGREG